MKTLRITENQIFKILKEDLNYQGIFELINSGDEDNITLAFQLIDGLDNNAKEKVFARLNANYGALLKLLNIKTPMSNFAINLMFRRTTITIDGVGYKELPYNIGILKDIKYISAPLNSLTSLPESIGDLVNLELLNLEYNYLTSLPNSIFNIKALEKIELKGNPITQDEIDKLKNNLPNTIILK